MISRFTFALMTLTLAAAPLLAQPQPAQPGQPRPNQPQQPGQPRPAQPGNPPLPGGEMRDEHMPIFERRNLPPQFQMIHGYLGIIDQLNQMVQDPTASGIAAVLGATEILKPRGSEAMITYFTKILPEVKNEAVQRAIRIQLVEAYKTSGDHDKALAELQTLMTGTPAKTE